MSGIVGFIVWLIVGCFIIGVGISAFFRKKAVGFWANMKALQVNANDIKKYNCAVGWLFIIYGVLFNILGIPLLGGRNSPLVLLSVVGVMLETIIMMGIYTLVIEKKYRA